MEIYKGHEIFQAPLDGETGMPTWYWVKRYHNDEPKLFPIYKNIPTKYGPAIWINCGYCQEITVYENNIDMSDVIDTVSIFGPVETVKDF